MCERMCACARKYMWMCAYMCMCVYVQGVCDRGREGGVGWWQGVLVRAEGGERTRSTSA